MFDEKQPTVASPIDPIVMCDFLAQFKSKNDWSVFRKDIVNKDALKAAKYNGFIKCLVPAKGGSYHETLVCTLKGRSYIRRHM